MICYDTKIDFAISALKIWSLMYHFLDSVPVDVTESDNIPLYEFRERFVGRVRAVRQKSVCMPLQIGKIGCFDRSLINFCRRLWSQFDRNSRWFLTRRLNSFLSRLCCFLLCRGQYSELKGGHAASAVVPAPIVTAKVGWPRRNGWIWYCCWHCLVNRHLRRLRGWCFAAV